MKNYLLLLAIIFLLGVSSPVGAFDVDGFKSGMTSLEVTRELQKDTKTFKFDSHKKFKAPSKIKGDMVYAYYREKPTSKYMPFFFAFRNDRLVMITKGYAPSYENFIKLLDEKTREYGKFAKISPHTEKIREVSVSWEFKDDVFSVKYSKDPRKPGSSYVLITEYVVSREVFMKW
ncbi:MAG: hypothetical protein WCJ37_03530 [Syntrophus sp. (in: bacteria)]